MEKSLHEFGQEMARLMPGFMREAMKRMAKPMTKGNITLTQMGILTVLREMKSCKMKDIAKSLYITTSAATGLVDRMVKAGFLKRVADDKDRRIILIEMTRKGSDIIEEIEKARFKMLMDMFGKLTSAERKRYLETVRKLCTIMTEGV